MLGQHHIVIGCTGVVAVQAATASGGQPFLEPASVAVWGYEVPDVPLLLAAAALGSLLPDLDHPRAMLGNLSPIVRIALAVPAFLLRHRGPTHSLAAWALLTWLAASTASEEVMLNGALAGSLGYLLHLVADSLTVAGVPWLWPLYGRPLGFPPHRHLRFSTGSPTEYLVVGGVLGAAAMLLQQTGWPPL